MFDLPIVEFAEIKILKEVVELAERNIKRQKQSSAVAFQCLLPLCVQRSKLRQSIDTRHECHHIHISVDVPTQDYDGRVN